MWSRRFTSLWKKRKEIVYFGWFEIYTHTHTGFFTEAIFTREQQEGRAGVWSTQETANDAEITLWK